MRAGIREELDGCDTRNDEPKTNQGGSIQLLAIEKPCDEGDQDDLDEDGECEIHGPKLLP